MAQQYRLIKVNTDSGQDPQPSSAADIYAAASASPSKISVNTGDLDPVEADLLGGEEPADDFVMPELSSALDRAAKEKAEGPAKRVRAFEEDSAKAASSSPKKSSADYETPMGGMRIAIMGASGVAVVAMILYCFGVIG